MTPEMRRQVLSTYLQVIELSPDTRVMVRAGTLELLIRELFAQERGSREERLDAAEKRADEIFRPALGAPGGQTAGSRQSHRKGPTPRAKPFTRHPAVQGNVLFH